ncbi:MAG: hypothetical protein Q8Q60_00655 [Candidatus Chromulinivorax sp.]|nr:hypothetical protein [Candidatus Chromulinivorax sp.]
MIKKLLLMFLTFLSAQLVWANPSFSKKNAGESRSFKSETDFVTVQAQDYDQDDLNPALQELVFDVGMSLAEQNTIVDIMSMKDALSHVYQDVYDVAQIVDMYMMIDEEIVEQNITTLDALIDYEINGNEVLAQAAIAWLLAYQDLFIIFTAIHQKDSSFEVWCEDMAILESLTDDEMPEDVAYLQLWLAACVFYEAQADFEYALRYAE